MADHIRHEEAWRVLDDYIDGALREEEAEAVAAHAAECAECRREIERIRHLVARASALPREIEPGRDLWPRVAERVGPRRSALPARLRRPGGRILAATIAAGLLLAAVGLMSGWKDRGERAQVERAESPEWNGALARSAARIEALRKECLAGSRAVVRALGRSGDLPGLTETYAENARLIDSAMADVERAWLSNPDEEEMAARLARLCKMRAYLTERIAESAVRSREVRA